MKPPTLVKLTTLAPMNISPKDVYSIWYNMSINKCWTSTTYSDMKMFILHQYCDMYIVLFFKMKQQFSMLNLTYNSNIQLFITNLTSFEIFSNFSHLNPSKEQFFFFFLLSNINSSNCCVDGGALTFLLPLIMCRFWCCPVSGNVFGLNVKILVFPSATDFSFGFSSLIWGIFHRFL